MSVTIGSGHEGNVREQINAYKARVKGGEMGALPSVLSLFVLTLLFSLLNPYFLTQGNFANLLTQTATLMMIAMALVFVILIAEIDLSAGVTSGVAMALFIIMTNRWGIDWRISIIAGLLCGAAIGAFINFGHAAATNNLTYVVSITELREGAHLSSPLSCLARCHV